MKSWPLAMAARPSGTRAAVMRVPRLATSRSLGETRYRGSSPSARSMRCGLSISMRPSSERSLIRSSCSPPLVGPPRGIRPAQSQAGANIRECHKGRRHGSEGISSRIGPARTADRAFFGSTRFIFAILNPLATEKWRTSSNCAFRGVQLECPSHSSATIWSWISRSGQVPVWDEPELRHVDPVPLLEKRAMGNREKIFQLLLQPAEAAADGVAPLLPTGRCVEFLWVREGEVEEDLVAFGVIGAIRFREPDVLPSPPQEKIKHPPVATSMLSMPQVQLLCLLKTGRGLVAELGWVRSPPLQSGCLKLQKSSSGVLERGLARFGPFVASVSALFGPGR